MNIKVGTDILDKRRFLKSCKSGGNTFLEKLFTPYEQRENSQEQLASIFCLKEALVKALELPNSSWLNINTTRKDNGKVDCSFTNEDIARRILSLDTSISHEREMIIAVAVVIIDNK